MAQRENMPEGTDSIIDGASGASSTSPSNADVVGGSGTGGTSGAIGGANTGGSLAGDFGSGSGTTGLGGASSGAGMSGSETGSMGASGGYTGADLGGTGGSGFGDAGTSGSTGSTGSSSSTGVGNPGLSGGVANLKSQAADKARQAAVQGKDRATDALGNLSTLARDAAQMIDERLGGGYGDYARKAADAVDNFTDGLRGKEVDEIFDDAKNLVRKSPGVAIGIAATVGFVLVRALKAGTDAGNGDMSASAANDGATPPLVDSRGGVA